jgi:hypothetical protein
MRPPAGIFQADYGTNIKANGLIGTEEFDWAWSEKSIFQYSVSYGAPELDPAETESGHFAPVLYDSSNWISKSAEASRGSPRQTPCDGYHEAPLDQLGYNTSFYEPFRVSSALTPNVLRAFQGKKWVLRIGGYGSPTYTPCGFYSNIPIGMEAPPANSYGIPDQASQPFGPYIYWVKMPPRNFLSQASGSPSEVSLDYDRVSSFTGCRTWNNITPCLPDDDHGQHKTSEETDITVDIRWFPSSELQNEINKLKRTAGR